MESENNSKSNVRDGVVVSRDMGFMNKSWCNWLLSVFGLLYLAFLNGGNLMAV